MVTIHEVINTLESIAPRRYAESYDNPGLLTGDRAEAVQGVVCCLDCTEDVVDDAIAKGDNLIVAHHPIIFKGLRALTGENYIERTILKAIRNNIAIYAIHTNLDSVLSHGVSERIAKLLELEDLAVLSSKEEEHEVECTVMDLRRLDIMSLIEATTGTPYQEQYQIDTPAGSRTRILWRGRSDQAQSLHQELIEQKIPSRISPVGHASNEVGLGVVGRLPIPMPEEAFLSFMKDKLQVSVIRHTPLLERSIERVALCGGSGAFLIGQAKRRNADIYITADVKYHEFFDADGQLVIADIGHYESEHATIGLLCELIHENFSTFAVRSTNVDTNPINYR